MHKSRRDLGDDDTRRLVRGARCSTLHDLFTVTVYFEDATVTVFHGDCLDVLRDIPDASIDSVVTDPPYGLEFMGKEWDGFTHLSPVTQTLTPAMQASTTPQHRQRGRALRQDWGQHNFQAWCQLWATECLRVLKPGAHLLSFGGTRTYHRLACAIEDAGFEIRDSITWLYATGFPKSLDVSKAIDRAAGVERDREPPQQRLRPSDALHTSGFGVDGWAPQVREPVTADAHRWRGWGTALKPAGEPIVVARKPLAGTVAGTVLAFGTGALNIDATRVAHASDGDLALSLTKNPGRNDTVTSNTYGSDRPQQSVNTAGRWPSNVVLSHAPGCEQVGTRRVRGHTGYPNGAGGSRFKFDPTPNRPDPVPGHAGADGRESVPVFACVAGCPVAELDTQSGETTSRVGQPRGAVHGDGWGMTATGAEYDDGGGASRFFPSFQFEAKAPTSERTRSVETAHPTVKPLDLMRWLVRLVTPPNGVCLDVFAGSGTTVEACILERFRCVAVEREAEYLPLIRHRVTRRRDPVAFHRDNGTDVGTLFEGLP